MNQIILMHISHVNLQIIYLVAQKYFTHHIKLMLNLMLYFYSFNFVLFWDKHNMYRFCLYTSGLCDNKTI
jgi:hypothetical protein